MGIEMELSNCIKCGHLLMNRTPLICDHCFEEHEKSFKKIKKFLLQNPNSTLLEVHKQTGVPIETINILIKDKRMRSDL